MIDVRTEAVLQRSLERARERHGAVGVTAAVRCEGLGPWTGASGSLDLAGREPIAPEACMPAYSITKTITAICMLRLAELGALDLDDPVGRWIPDLPFGDRVQLAQLLDHTAGVPNYSEIPEQIAALAASPRNAWTFDEFVAHSCQRSLDFAPGCGWAYSNTGYMLLRRVVERASGGSFAEAVERHVAGPLGFSATRVMQAPADFSPLAPGYSRRFSAAGALCDVRDAYDPGWCATGLVSSNAAELCELYAALFGGKLVRRDSLARMTRLVAVPGDHPPAVSPSYGLGLMADPDGDFGPEFGHGGGGPGYSLHAACYVGFKQRRVCVAVMCNRDESDAWAVERDLLASLLSQLGETVSLS